jgi:hypothetical protein
MRLESPEDRSARIVKAFRTALVLVAAVATAAQAATFPELYTVSVPTDSAATNIRADAERRAMGVLLTRITGRRLPESQEETAGLIRNASDYVTSYQSAADEIRVGFSRTGVNAALTNLNLPIWGAERPSTLVWIAADLGGGERTELMADTVTPRRRPGEVAGQATVPLSNDARISFEAIVDELVTAADERGLPIVLPLFDFQDQAVVSFADVWAGFDLQVAQAAERYAVDAVLIGRVVVTTFGLEVRWTLLNGEQSQGRISNDVRSGIDWLADEFAARFITVGGARTTWVTVHGIETWPDFGRVVEYLQSVSVIDGASVNVESWNQGSLLIRLAARGDDATLRQYLELDGALRTAGAEGSGNAAASAPQGRLEFVPGWLADPAATSGL